MPPIPRRPTRRHEAKNKTRSQPNASERVYRRLAPGGVVRGRPLIFNSGNERKGSWAMPTFRIAAVQDAPEFMDREATVAKTCALIAEAARGGARLVVFPEAFIPTYPDWVWRVPPGEHQMLADLYGELLDQSVAIPSLTTEQLCRAARQAGVYVVVGLNERNTEASNATLYNTLLYIDAGGNLLGKHQKLVPTAPE